MSHYKTVRKRFLFLNTYQVITPTWSVAHSTTVHEFERKMNSQRLNKRTRGLQQGPVRRKTGRAETGRTFCADGRPIEIRARLMKSREGMCKHKRAMFGTSWLQRAKACKTKRGLHTTTTYHVYPYGVAQLICSKAETD